MERLGCMAEHWIFRYLDAAARQVVLDSVVRRRFKAGETLFWQGDPATSIFLVTAGRIRLCKTTEEGREIVLGYLTPHDLFGEESLFAVVPQTVSAVGAESGALCVCHKADFERLLRSNQDVALAVVQVLGEKLRETTEQWAAGASAPVRDRLQHTLSLLARKYGEVTPAGVRLGFRLTHEELGALVGASRVMVTYALGDLRRAGLVWEDDARHLVVATEVTNLVPEVMTPPTPACPCFHTLRG
jgi:CRP/FNR family cyclic AMP-dependent transcriptional regulator